jgi:hypothetical protein
VSRLVLPHSTAGIRKAFPAVKIQHLGRLDGCTRIASPWQLRAFRLRRDRQSLQRESAAPKTEDSREDARGKMCQESAEDFLVKRLFDDLIGDV